MFSVGWRKEVVGRMDDNSSFFISYSCHLSFLLRIVFLFTDQIEKFFVFLRVLLLWFVVVVLHFCNSLFGMLEGGGGVEVGRRNVGMLWF